LLLAFVIYFGHKDQHIPNSLLTIAAPSPQDAPQKHCSTNL